MCVARGEKKPKLSTPVKRRVRGRNEEEEEAFCWSQSRQKALPETRRWQIWKKWLRTVPLLVKLPLIESENHNC